MTLSLNIYTFWFVKHCTEGFRVHILLCWLAIEQWIRSMYKYSTFFITALGEKPNFTNNTILVQRGAWLLYMHVYSLERGRDYCWKPEIHHRSKIPFLRCMFGCRMGRTLHQSNMTICRSPEVATSPFRWSKPWLSSSVWLHSCRQRFKYKQVWDNCVS